MTFRAPYSIKEPLTSPFAHVLREWRLIGCELTVDELFICPEWRELENEKAGLLHRMFAKAKF